MLNTFFVEYLSSKQCDKNCYYCDIPNKNITNMFEGDLDFFKWSLNILSKHSIDNLMVEICGGEPGLMSNLPSFLKVLRDNKSVIKTQLMSNGLVRINFPTLEYEFDSYIEHLIKDIDGYKFLKFHDLDIRFHSNKKNVIVLTEKTTKSLLNNFERFKCAGIFNPKNFWFKQYVQRTTPNKHKQDIIKLFTKMNEINETEYNHYCISELSKQNLTAQSICSRRPHLSCIDLEDKSIIHCAYHNFTNVFSKPCTEQNLKKMIDRILFFNDEPEYCKDCYQYFRNTTDHLRTKKCNR